MSARMIQNGGAAHDRDRSADERDRLVDAREAEADKRDRRADERDRVADRREETADERDRRADAREAAIDEREWRVDHREHVADKREQLMEDWSPHGAPSPDETPEQHRLSAVKRSLARVASSRRTIDQSQAQLRSPGGKDPAGARDTDSDAQTWHRRGRIRPPRQN
jgi:hypothetical protein